jgi:hypothetical protein
MEPLLYRTNITGHLLEKAARWAAARQSRIDPVQTEKNCRAYGIHFYETVTARQAVSTAETASIINGI